MVEKINQRLYFINILIIIIIISQEESVVLIRKEKREAFVRTVKML